MNTEIEFIFDLESNDETRKRLIMLTLVKLIENYEKENENTDS